MTENDLEKAIAAMRRGATIERAAKEIGVSRALLASYIHRMGGRAVLGVPHAQPWKSKTERGPDDLVRLLLAGAAASCIRDAWGVSSTTMEDRIRWLRASGMLPANFRGFNPRYWADNRHDAAIRAGVDAGMSVFDIGKELLIPTDFVERRIGRMPDKEVDPLPPPMADEKPTRPRGWSMTEQEAAALYAKAGRGYGPACNHIRG